MKWMRNQGLARLRDLVGAGHAIMSLLAVLVGLAAGLGAVCFRHLINFFQRLAYGPGDDLIDILPALPWSAKVWVPAVGGLIVGPLVYFWAREAKGHGVPEVMEAVALKGGLIRKRIVVVKSLASAICIGSGGAVGREGPIVQIGSAIGSAIGQVFRISADRMRTLVGCGAAAGIAATFNAPIAGAMFALEIILSDFGLATFSPIVISAVVATAISRHFLGDFPAFIVPAYELVSLWEFPLYLLLGVICAGLGVVFVNALYWSEDLFERVAIPEYLKAGVGGLIIGAAALWVPHILGVGYGSIDLCLAAKMTWYLLMALIFCKIAATAVTIGSGGSGGIFAPSLFIGAMAGGCFGLIVHDLFPQATASPGAYGIVAMGALVSATTHGPLTAILMLFEMTGDYKIILPLMITCIISTLVAGQLFRETIYTFKLIRRGVDIRGGREINTLKSMRVADVMNPSVETIFEGMPLGVLSKTIAKSKYNSFPVLDQANRLTGIISFSDYRDAVFDEHLKDLIIAKDLATTKVTTIDLKTDLYQALETIMVQDFAILPVVATDNPRCLLGVISRRDIIGAYDKAIVKKSLFHAKSTETNAISR
jgi:CIC family chloride channel protein